MGSLHEYHTLTDAKYMVETSAQQAIIEEIQGLRYDLHNAGGDLSNELAYAILRLCERLERS